MMMIPLADLIAHHKRREVECAAERDRINAQAISKHFSEKDQERCAATFEQERKIARDTASWLETIAKRAV